VFSLRWVPNRCILFVLTSPPTKRRAVKLHHPLTGVWRITNKTPLLLLQISVNVNKWSVLCTDHCVPFIESPARNRTETVRITHFATPKNEMLQSRDPLFPCCTQRPTCRTYIRLLRYKTEAAITRANSFAYPNIDKGSSSNLDHMSSSSGPPRQTGVTSSTPELPAAAHPSWTEIQALLYEHNAHEVALLSMSTQYAVSHHQRC
jgi:hypothetical protein